MQSLAEIFFEFSNHLYREQLVFFGLGRNACGRMSEEKLYSESHGWEEEGMAMMNRLRGYSQTIIDSVSRLKHIY